MFHVPLVPLVAQLPTRQEATDDSWTSSTIEHLLLHSFENSFDNYQLLISLVHCALCTVDVREMDIQLGYIGHCAVSNIK